MYGKLLISLSSSTSTALHVVGRQRNGKRKLKRILDNHFRVFEKTPEAFGDCNGSVNLGSSTSSASGKVETHALGSLCAGEEAWVTTSLQASRTVQLTIMNLFDLGALEDTDDDGRQHSQIHFLV